MKHLVVCLSLLVTGCFGQTYDSNRIGPDRYTITSLGHETGPSNYGHMLETAYRTCTEASFKDYVVTSLAFDTRQVIMFVRCEQNVVRQDLTVQPAAPPSPNDKQTSLSDDLNKLYQSAKKKFEDASKE